jgi:hypothetical protein
LSPASHCPVCQARFRGADICSRCGADLGRLMLLSAEAWRLREAARTAIAYGSFERGFELAVKAQEAQSTPAGKTLRTIGEWLMNESAGAR